MFRHILIPALASVALVPAAGWAQSMPPPVDPGSAATKDNDAHQNLPQKIHDKLTAKGFKDVVVVPNSFIVRAKDKDDNPVMMLIGPNGMTMIKKPKAGDPSTAQHKDDNDEIIQQ
jgi:hypothetical protein